VRSLRTTLIAAFVVATILPMAATIWIATSLLERSLGYATTQELDRITRALESTARQLYQREREALRESVRQGHPPAATYTGMDRASWPEDVRAFWEGDEAERVVLSGSGGDHLDLMRRGAGGVDVYRRPLGGVRMQALSDELRRSRQLVTSLEGRDLRRGFTLTLLLLVASVWLMSLVPLLFLAHRISQPIRQLTAGLTGFAAGDWDRRLAPGRDDEVGWAVKAFNDMADQLRRGRERLVYLTQMSSWQTLARKTAHELKNSLTPIRLTVEEMLARQPAADRAFMEQATQIVVGEIETLERRVRAFSEFASEPAVDAGAFDLNVMVAERVALLKPAHPETAYRLQLDAAGANLNAGRDLAKGILTNLLENAAEAAGAGGSVLTITRAQGTHVVVDVHDSGPGLSDETRRTLFEPTITFKKHGMGLGLSIARKNALLLGGDITLVTGMLGGAGFRVTLPCAPATARPAS
jgi:two-component system, NtrC family, nitrogen regulation sensor histidine kinase NtrY